MYYISLELDTSCSSEFKQQLLERGFHIALVGNLSLKRIPVTSPNILFLPGEKSHYECIANLKGEHNFPSLKMLYFLFKHRAEFKHWNLGSLPF